MEKKEIVLSCDHGGYKLKEYLKEKLEKDQFKVIDLGIHSPESADYPDIIAKGAKAIHSGQYAKGLFICGSGEGATMAANRFKKVRAALVYSKETAKLSREHNNANVIVFGERLINFKKAYNLFKVWWHTPFSEGERHIRRVKKLNGLGS